MKFSVKDPAFPWFEPLKCSAFKLDIRLDGEPLLDCVAFDTVEGWADVHAKDASGKFRVVAGEIFVERLRGVVTLGVKP